MEHEDDALGRRHALEDDEQREPHALIHRHHIGGVGLRVLQREQRLGEPGTDVGLALDSRRSELVEAKPAHDDDQPCANVFDRVEVGAQEPAERLLHDVFRIAVAAQQPVRDVEQKTVVLRPGLVEP